MPNQTVTVVAESEFYASRKAIGLHPPNCSPAQVLIKPSHADIERIVQSSDRTSSVHILNGLPGVALNRRVIRHLAKTGAMIGLLSEGANRRGVRGLPRRAKYILERYYFGRNLDFILAMGELGVYWFKSVGYDPLYIFPFAYVTERPTETSGGNRETRASEPFRILYLGQLIRRKGGEMAIRALAGISGSDWSFDVVGSGPELVSWKREADASRNSDRIRIRPPVDNASIGDLFDHSDLLVLPSRWDGWGAVVNEALMCGVPVVCSDNCGAADLLREPWRGGVFRAGSVKSLREVLQEQIAHGKRSDATSARIREWSSVLEGPRVARYLVEIVEHLQYGGQRPSPPWY